MITPTKSFKVGRFTIVEVKEIIKDTTGKDKVFSGVGVARCSDMDKYDRNIALSIATGRAYKALEAKKNNKKIQSLLMG